jgi:hypothetical protein
MKDILGFSSAKKVTKLWLWLLAFNAFMAIPSVEDLFNQNNYVEYTKYEVCAQSGHYKKDSDSKGTYLFAFLGSAVNLNSKIDKSDSYLDCLNQNILTSTTLISFKETLSKKAFYKALNSRGPPLV